MTESDIVKVLTEESEEFRKLGEEHKDLDGMLSELAGRVYLTAEEEMEKKKLKKLKLLKKDRRAEIIRKYREAL